MMRTVLIPLALAVATACLSGGSAAHESGSPAPIVDVFPAQSWASLGAEPARDDAPPVAAPEPAPEPEPPSLDTPIDAPPAAAVPFEIAGEWRESGQRIVVLEGIGKTFLLCGSRCDVRDAVRPGDEIAEGYRLKKLGEQGTVIVTRGSADVELSLPVPIQ
ncbi:hypothetical protein ABXK61_12895 [Burkholderia sola]|uniref:hypothetical protein n=1 Tax=Burkholderia TaxID=32008 RepID=UPI001AEA868C|nr:hypothetical protein [Burkholderia sp. AcTa6-5]MBP0714209.1 hypothetical protein [Burkholderia sp. AcTa6-5]